MLCRIYGQGWDPKDIVTCNLTLDLKVTVCFIWGDLSDHQTSDWVDVLTKNSPVIWWNIAGGLRWRGLVASGTGEALSWIQEVQFEEQICDPEGLSGAKQLSYRILQIFFTIFCHEECMSCNLRRIWAWLTNAAACRMISCFMASKKAEPGSVIHLKCSNM